MNPALFGGPVGYSMQLLSRFCPRTEVRSATITGRFQYPPFSRNLKRSKTKAISPTSSASPRPEDGALGGVGEPLPCVARRRHLDFRGSVLEALGLEES